MLGNPVMLVDPNGKNPTIPKDEAQRKITSTVGNNNSTIITEQYQEVKTRMVETSHSIALANGTTHTYTSTKQVTTRTTTNTIVVVSENGELITSSQASVIETTDQKTGTTEVTTSSAIGNDVKLSGQVESFVGAISYSYARQEAVNPGGIKMHINYYLSGNASFANLGSKASYAGGGLLVAAGAVSKTPAAPLAPYLGTAGGVMTGIGFMTTYATDSRSTASATVFDTTPLHGRSSPPGRPQALYGLRDLLAKEIQ